MKRSASSKASKPWPSLGRSPISGQYVLAPAKRPSATQEARIRDAVRAVVAGRRD